MEILTLESFKTKIFDFEKNKEWKFSGPRPAIIDFYADWCGPCRAVATVLEQISKEFAGKVDVYKVDTDKSPELAALFQVRSIPTILFVPMQGEPGMANGYMPPESFHKAIEDLFGIKK